MRLTLRTLLAYLDGTLDAAEVAVLRPKIEQAAMAKTLIDRIDKSLESDALPALRIDASGTAGDANTVAEYLDNTLAPQIVGDFESACMNDDARLAELAACHQILSSAITTQQHVTAELRNRIRIEISEKLTFRNADSDAYAYPVSDPNAVLQSSIPTTSPASPSHDSGSSHKLSALSQSEVQSPATVGSDTVSNANDSSTHASSVAVQNSRRSDETPDPGARLRSSRTTNQAVTATSSRSIANHAGIDLSEESKLSVPSYLRSASSTNIRQAALTAILAASVLALAYFAIGPFERLTKHFDIAEANDAALQSVDGADGSANGAKQVNTLPENNRQGVVDTSNTSNASNSSLESNPIKNDSVETSPKSSANIANSEVEQAPTSGHDDAEQPTSEPVRLNNDGSISLDESDGEVAVPESQNGETLSNKAPDQPPAFRVVAGPAISWRPETKEASDAMILSISARDAETAIVKKVAPGEGMQVGERWLIPTANRTDLWLEPGIRWLAADTTDIGLSRVAEAVGMGGASDPRVANVRLQLGRALLSATPDCSTVAIETRDGVLAVIRFGDTSSKAAIELRYECDPGVAIAELPDDAATGSSNTSVAEDDRVEKSEPEALRPPKGAFKPVFTVIGVAGQTEVEYRGNNSVEVPVGQIHSWSEINGVSMSLLQSLPWWLNKNAIKPVDVEMSRSLQMSIVDLPGAESDSNAEGVAATPPTKGNKPPEPTLIDKLFITSASKPWGQAAMASHTLMLMGDYSSVVGTEGLLSNPAVRPYRQMLLDTLEQSLGADSMREHYLKEQILQIDPARGPRLIRLFCLPTNKMLDDGIDRMLTDSISSPFLDERVIGIHQLSKITGRDYGFQADKPSTESLQTWKKMLNGDKIRWQKAKK